jgi:hypothetical protein
MLICPIATAHMNPVQGKEFVVNVLDITFPIRSFPHVSSLRKLRGLMIEA